MLLDKARAFRALADEKAAVVARIRDYVAPWKHDRRLRVMGEIFLREIDRIEAEEAEKTKRG